MSNTELKKVNTSNKYASDFVTKREPFKASNTFGQWVTEGLYVVYSYGYHFPMFAYSTETDMWFKNTDKYSRSTSKQQSQLRPRTDKHMIELNTSHMKILMQEKGILELTIEKARV